MKVKKIKISLSNARSLRRKELAVENHICCYAIDAMVITETWLKEDDDMWKNACCLNSNGLHINTINRKTGQRGGGIGLKWNENKKCKGLNTSETKSFKSGVWKIEINSNKITIITTYRPPQSQQELGTIAAFSDEFVEYYSNIVAKNSNIIIMGDFNIHVDNLEDKNSIQFLEMIEVMGLQQNVKIPTYRDDHIQDQILVEMSSNVEIIKVGAMDFLTDHVILDCTLRIDKASIKKMLR